MLDDWYIIGVYKMILVNLISPNPSREAAFRDSRSSFNRFVAIDASSVFRCKTWHMQINFSMTFLYPTIHAEGVKTCYHLLPLIQCQQFVHLVLIPPSLFLKLRTNKVYIKTNQCLVQTQLELDQHKRKVWTWNSL